MKTPMKTIERRSFATFEDFREFARGVRLLFFHVFAGQPDPDVLDALSTWSPHETLLLLEVGEDQGFLRKTLITPEVRLGQIPVSKPLSQMRGLGAWANGTIVGFTEDPILFDKIVRTGRHAISIPIQTPTRQVYRKLIEERLRQ